MKLHPWLAGIAGFLCAAAVPAAPGEAPRVSTTVYVGRHFEGRDHDQPVKYVFNGDTRVARITGSLSANARIQRLRLRAGWNLCGMAVEGGGFPASAEIAAVLRWNPVTRDYAVVAPGEPLAAGSVLWVKAATNTMVSLTGSYVDPGPVALDPGGTYLPAAGLEASPLQLPEGVTVWRFDAATARWEAGFAGDLAPLGSLPSKLAPGEAIYVHTDAPVELAVPEPALRVSFYHQDHLGSSSAVTDAAGELVEETGYHPFGAVHQKQRLREFEAHYGFNQKERDEESGLQYFGQRHYLPALGRWLATDPKAEAGGGANPYAYVNQNPLKLQDAEGADITISRVVDRKRGTTTYNIHLKAALIDASSKKFDQQALAQYAARLKSTIEQSFTGKEGKVQWNTSVDLRVIQDWGKVEQDQHVFRIVDRTKSDSAGSARIGGRLMDLAASALRAPTPDQVDRSNPANKHYTWEHYHSPEGTGAHEFGHSAGLGHEDHQPNLMQSGGARKHDVKNIGRHQIETIFKAYQKRQLNQPDPDLNELTKPR